MQYVIFNKGWLFVSGYFRSFKTTSHVDTYIYNHSPFFHMLYHSFSDDDRTTFFAAHGANVAIVVRETVDRAEAVADEIRSLGGKAAAVQADVGGHASVQAAFAAAAAALGPVTLLVNNAGAGVDHDFREAAPDLAASDATIFLNLNAPIHLIAALMPVLKSRPEAMIVNVTSGLAIAPRAGGPVYCATKAALRSYSQALRYQLKGTNVHVLEALLFHKQLQKQHMKF